MLPPCPRSRASPRGKRGAHPGARPSAQAQAPNRPCPQGPSPGYSSWPAASGGQASGLEGTLCLLHGFESSKGRGLADLGSTPVSTRSYVTLGQRTPKLWLSFLTPKMVQCCCQDSERFASICIRPDTDRHSASCVCRHHGCYAVTTPGPRHTGPPLPVGPHGAQVLGPSLPGQCQGLSLCLGPAPTSCIPRRRRGPSLGPCPLWVRPGPANAGNVPKLPRPGPPPSVASRELGFRSLAPRSRPARPLKLSLTLSSLCPPCLP